MGSLLVHRVGGEVVRRVVLSGDDYVRRLRPERVVPVHYDDYRVFRSPLGDFLAAAERAGLRHAVQVVDRGVTVPL